MRVKALQAVSRSRLSRAEWAKAFQSPSATPKHAVAYASLNDNNNSNNEFIELLH